MLIREPKFKPGDKVYCNEFKCNAIITGIADYSFADDKYYYSIRCEDGDNYEMIETELEPYQEKPKTIWDLKVGDKCFFINSIGSMIPVKWDGTYCAIRNLEIGNVFLTKEEAEMEIERRKVEVQMFRFGGHRKYDYKGNNFCFSYDQEKDSVNICLADFGSAWQPGEGIYFSKREEAEKALIEIGEDKMIKYLFSIDLEKTDD